MTYLILFCLTLLPLRPAAAAALDDSVQQHLAEVAGRLPAGSPLRVAIQQGAQGDGSRASYMDLMKALHVKRAVVEVTSSYRSKNNAPMVKRCMYFDTYGGAGQRIVGVSLDSPRATELQREVETEAIRQARGASFIREAPKIHSGTRVAYFATLYDDEWLPRLPSGLVVEPHESAFLLAAWAGDSVGVAELASTNVPDFSHAMFENLNGPRPDAGVVEVLLERGANPNSVRSGGFTCLMDAARDGDVELAEALLKHGAKIDVRNSKGETALDIARQWRNSPIIALLRTH